MVTGTGVGISSDIMKIFEDMKLRKKYKFITFKMSPDNTQIVVDKLAETGEYEDFLKEFPRHECRYGLFDFVYDSKEGTRQRLCFFLWTPADASPRDLMLYASSKVQLRECFSGGVYADIQATDPSETAYEEVINRLEK